MYSLKEISDKKKWNDFIIKSNFSFYSFLQSWQWGEFQIKCGKSVIRYAIFDNKNIVGLMQIIKIRAKRASYLFIPHGPLIKGNFFDVFDKIIIELKNYAINEKFDFIRINSGLKNLVKNKISFKKLGFINAPMHEHAEDTHLLDLNQTQDNLLKNIKKKDRYYINRAIKQAVKIVVGNNEKQKNTLIKMHIAHSKKIGYHHFSENFINFLYEIFGDDISTISASFDGKVESILMTIKFGKTCVYYIAASDIVNHKFSPNYLCQWEAIKKAKMDGCEVYNFWGVSPDDNKKHPISGVTKFKRKFGGYDYSLLHAQDLVLSKKYWFNWIIETIRRKKRGYYYKKLESK